MARVSVCDSAMQNITPHSLPLAARVKAEAIRQNFDNMGPALYSTAIASIFVCFAVSGVTPLPVWSSWLVVMYGLLLLRALLLRAYRRSAPGLEAMPRWGLLSAWGAVCSGAMWGISIPLFALSDSLPHLFFLTMVVAVLSTTAGVASASYLPALYGFYVPAMVPLPLYMLWQAEGLRLITGIMFLIYLPIYMAFVLKIHRSLVQSIRLRLEKEMLAEQLAQRTEVAEMATLEKSRFLAAASHDLRQPVYALALFVESLKDEVSTPQQQKLVNRIEQSITAMDGLFHSLLDISRLDSGMVKPSFSSFPVQRLLDRMALTFIGMAETRGLRLTIVPCSAWVQSDYALCEQLLHNLVSNALKHTRQGGVVVGCRRRGKQLVVAVHDSGPGIAEAHHQDIFQEFFQLHNEERDRSKGLGLGLAIVRRIADLLQATLSLRSTPGHGACFSVALPRIAPVILAAPASEVEVASDDEVVVGKLVAVIDDESQIREGLELLLQKWGAQPVVAGSAAELIALLHDSRSGQPRIPDALICDYRLRAGESGIEAVQRLGEEFNRDIPALLVTGDTGGDRLLEAEASHLPLLHKPVRPRLLKNALAALLRTTPGM